MTYSPVIEADLGDGETRRLYLGASEIKIFEVEAGMGWRSFYNAMAIGNVQHDQIKRALRLALIGGGEDSSKAAEIVEYCANPPRALQPVWIAVSKCLEALWNGYKETGKKSGKKATDEDLDKILEIMQANFIRAGHSVDLTDMSMAQVVALHERVFGDKDKPEAPDAETFNAIKAQYKKKGRKKG